MRTDGLGSDRDGLFLSAATEAVDAALITKQVALARFSVEQRIPLGDIAAIGDSVNDIPILEIRQLGLVGAPMNAQSRVKEAVTSHRNGYLARGESLDGFEEFYAVSADAGIRYIFADRDGVLTPTDDSGSRRLRFLFERMGDDRRPFIVVITGASSQQNLGFVQGHGLDRTLASNSHVRRNPYVINAENGLLLLNVLTGEVSERLHWVNAELLAILQQQFRPLLLRRIETRVLPTFELEWSIDRSNRESRLYLPEKHAMLTLNIPRTHRGSDTYRHSVEAEQLREVLLEEMVATANELGLPYHVL